jgi:hypothetical protein
MFDQTPFHVRPHRFNEARDKSLPVANMINRAGVVVLPVVSSLTAAVLELGSRFDSKGFSPLVDALSTQVWPICGYTYVVMRKTATRTTCLVLILSPRFNLVYSVWQRVVEKERRLEK